VVSAPPLHMCSKAISLTPKYTDTLGVCCLELAEGAQLPALALNTAWSKLAPGAADCMKHVHTFAGPGLTD